MCGLAYISSEPILQQALSYLRSGMNGTDRSWTLTLRPRSLRYLNVSQMQVDCVFGYAELLRHAGDGILHIEDTSLIEQADDLLIFVACAHRFIPVYLRLRVL